MPMPAQHRQAIVRAAVALFRKQGFAATGLNEILSRSGAPKGSLYHYFPGGKAELGEAAVRQAGATVTRTLSALRDETPGPPAGPLRDLGARGRARAGQGRTRRRGLAGGGGRAGGDHGGPEPRFHAI